MQWSTVLDRKRKKNIAKKRKKTIAKSAKNTYFFLFFSLFPPELAFFSVFGEMANWKKIANFGEKFLKMEKFIFSAYLGEKIQYLFFLEFSRMFKLA